MARCKQVKYCDFLLSNGNARLSVWVSFGSEEMALQKRRSGRRFSRIAPTRCRWPNSSQCASEKQAAGNRQRPAPELALVSCFLSVPGGDEISQPAKAAVPAATDTAAGIFGLDGLVT